MVRISAPFSFLLLVSTTSAFPFENALTSLFHRRWMELPIFAPYVVDAHIKHIPSPPSSSSQPPAPASALVPARTSYIVPLATPSSSSETSRRRTKRQSSTNSGIGNSGSGNSGNYNCGNGNSGNNNNGNGNSGDGNSGDGQSGDGNGSGACGNVVVSQSEIYIYPAASTIVYQQPAYTSVIVYQQPEVYTTYIIVQQPAVTSVLYQAPSVVPIVTEQTTLPRGCAYWENLGYQCSGASHLHASIGVLGVILAGCITGFLLV